MLGAHRSAAVHGGRARHEDRLVAAGIVASLAYYYLVPSPLLALPGLICFAGLAWLRLDLALCLLPFTFPFWYVPKRVAGHIVFPLSEIALGICTIVALLAIIGQLLRSRYGYAHFTRHARALVARLGHWLIVGALLLLAGTALGIVIARRPHEALRAWRWEVVEPLLYLLLVATTVRRAHLARWMIWSFLGSALLLALLAAIQVFWLHVTFAPLAQGNTLIPYTSAAGNVPRATAFIYGSGNSLGAWLARALPLTLALSLTGTGDTIMSWKSIALGRERLAAAICGIVCVPGLLWSASRGAWIAAGVSCLVVLCMAWRRIWPAVAALLLGLLVVIWRHDSLMATVLAGHGGSGEVRTLVWLAAWHMITDHVLLGIGPDQFLYYYSNHYTSHPYWITRLNGHSTPAAREPDLAQPHNLLLDLWLSGGLLGLVGFIIVLAAFWRRCLRLWRLHYSQRTAGGERWYAAATLGIAGAVLAGVLHGMVDNAYFVPDLALFFWWALATVIVIERGLPRHTSTVTYKPAEGAEHHGEA